VEIVTGGVAIANSVLGTWWGQRKWHPTSVDVEKVGGAITAIAILLMYVLAARLWWFTPVLGIIAITTSGLTVLSGLRYSYLLTLLRYVRLISTGRNHHATEYIIGGSVLTAIAAKARKQGMSIQDILASCGYEPDHVWPRDSRADNERTVSRAYLMVTCAGSIALASIGILAARLLVG
jgi:hypothetical protein